MIDDGRYLIDDEERCWWYLSSLANGGRTFMIDDDRWWWMIDDRAHAHPRMIPRWQQHEPTMLPSWHHEDPTTPNYPEAISPQTLDRLNSCIHDEKPSCYSQRWISTWVPTCSQHCTGACLCKGSLVFGCPPISDWVCQDACWTQPDNFNGWVAMGPPPILLWAVCARSVKQKDASCQKIDFWWLQI